MTHVTTRGNDYRKYDLACLGIMITNLSTSPLSLAIKNMAPHTSLSYSTEKPSFVTKIVKLLTDPLQNCQEVS